MIKGKSPEEIRKTFNIQNDFTPEEEDQIRRENEWAEEYVLPLCPRSLIFANRASTLTPLQSLKNLRLPLTEHRFPARILYTVQPPSPWSVLQT